MGGALPLGYNLPEAGTHKLQVNGDEACTVRRTFARYLDLGSVHSLQRELAAEGVRSKLRVTAAGKRLGGGIISRGALFHLLRNRIYLGQIVHHDQVHEGEHEAIIETDQFERVAAMLDANARRHGAKQQSRLIKAPLTGKLIDASGEPMSPTFSQGKSGKSYRYDVSASLQQGSARDDDAIIRRLPAQAIERMVGEAVERWTGTVRSLDEVRAVRLVDGGLMVELEKGPRDDLALRLANGERLLRKGRKSAAVFLPLAMPLRGGRRLVVHGSRTSSRPDPRLIAALRKAHRMLVLDKGMPVIEAAPVSLYDRRILRLAFLAPDIQQGILAGRQPATLNLEQLMQNDVPLTWKEQRKALGWPARDHPLS